ncbi:hypothetical protein [Actinomyces sp. ZJ308]|uniref:hypothetical protein n=1 Tax=Actinomyces sp. ZJ308 TaxID=2708342 RepID=UPI001FB9DC31|nr:hypothetical protein [Actinomyces sp. ZJ308]
MHHRTLVVTFAASASLCLALAGCSGTSGSSEAGSSASASTASTGPIGTVDPPSDIKDLDKLGLSKATMSIKTEPRLSNYDEKGLTYVDPITDPTADLSVHHVTWDGKEDWKASVPVPSGADPTSLTPMMSYDDALGVVSYWFTTDQIDPEDSTLRLHPVSGPLHWFVTSTGQQGSDPFASEGNTYTSHKMLVGGLQMAPDGGMSAVKVVDPSYTLVSHSPQELGLTNGSRGEFYSWKGQVRIRGTQPENPADLLQLNTTKPVPDLSADARIWTTPTRILVLDQSDSRLQAVTENGAQALDLKGCSIPPKSNLKVGSGDSYDYIGQLRIAQDGTTECLSEQIGNASDTISATLSDGSIVSRSTSDEGKTFSYRYISADGSTKVSLSEKPVLDTYGDHLVYSTVADGVSTATAFNEKDLRPSGS